jgi:hypothetical protein
VSIDLLLLGEDVAGGKDIPIAAQSRLLKFSLFFAFLSPHPLPPLRRRVQAAPNFISSFGRLV